MSGFWAGRRVLVTGIAGFIGSHLARRLLDLGADVAGLDRVPDSPCLRVHGLSGKIPVLVRDLAGDLDRVLRAVAAGDGDWRFEGSRSVAEWTPPGVVFHLAGPSGIAAAGADPLGTWEAAGRGTWAILEACRRLHAGVAAVVAASSNHVYGGVRDHRVERRAEYPQGFPETAESLQSDAYGTSKQIVDALVRCYGRSYNLPVVSLRHVNAAGPADPHPHLIPSVLLALLDGERPVVHSDGTPEKAYLSVADVVAAYLRLAEGLAGRRIPPGGAWNAAPLHPISVLALTALLIRIAGQATAPDVRGTDLSQSGYVESLDSSRLRALGWSPDDDYAHWLPAVWEWYRAHGTRWLTDYTREDAT